MSVYDATGTAAPAPGTTGPATIYQSGGPTVVPVAAYTSAPFPGAQFYQAPVIYSAEQFPPGAAVATTPSQPTSSNSSQGAAPATPNGQMPQYPIAATYPFSYTYPTSGKIVVYTSLFSTNLTLNN